MTKQPLYFSFIYDAGDSAIMKLKRIIECMYMSIIFHFKWMCLVYISRKTLPQYYDSWKFDAKNANYQPFFADGV